MDKKLRKWEDENGELFSVGRKGSRYYIQSITPAWEPGAGDIHRTFVSKDAARNFDPDPLGELYYDEIDSF